MLLLCVRQLPHPVRYTLGSRSIAIKGNGILEQYERLVRAQKLQPDPRQLHVAERLQQLQDKLITWQPPPVGKYDEWINHNPVELNSHDDDILLG